MKITRVNFYQALLLIISRLVGITNSGLSKIPVLSVIPHCRFNDFYDSAKQVFVVLLISTMPIWLGAWVMLISTDCEESFIKLMYANIKEGELFIYATSTIAPVLYLMTVDPPKDRTHPSRLGYYLCFCLVMILSATAFGVQRMDNQSNTAFIALASWVLFIFSIILLFLSTAYINSFDDKNETTPDDLKEDVKEHQKGYAAYRRAKS